MTIDAPDPQSDERAEIRDFVCGAVGREIDDDTNFFESGFVTSLFGVQLILFLETSFSIAIGDEDLDIENFSSIARICGFVKRKRSTSRHRSADRVAEV